MSPTSKHEHDLARLRTTMRALLIGQHGPGVIAPGTQMPTELDDVIDQYADHDKEIHREGDALRRAIPDDDLGCKVSDFYTSIRVAYGDAGYFVGVAMGLELARLVGGETTPIAVTSRAAKKGGRR